MQPGPDPNPRRGGTAWRDVLAGLSLASMNIPQVLGYTRIAGTPVVTGLYTALLPVVAFAAFGSSRHMVVAADSATAAIISGSLSGRAEPMSAHYVALAGMVALLAAAMLLLARLFRLGFLADFLSRTVLVGFLTGVGVQVGIAMLGDMLAVPANSHIPLLQLLQIAQALPRIGWREAALSAGVVGAVLVGHRLAPRAPVGMLLVVGSIAASAVFGFERRGIAVLGPVGGGLPDFGLPSVDWRESVALLPVAASCVVMIIAQSAATSRSFAQRHGEPVDPDRDLLGLSAANAAAACSGAFVVNGSPTQTAMADAAGARSQLAQVTFAGVALAVLLFLTAPLQYLPRCVLAALVFTIAVTMVDHRGLRAIRGESPGEFRLAVLTALAVVAVGVEVGILFAIGLSLLRHVRHSYRPHAGVLVRDPDGGWMAAPTQSALQTEPGVIVYRFGADLFYANEQRFADEVLHLARDASPPLAALVVDASAISAIDYSAAQSLRALMAELAARGIELVFGRVSDGLRADLARHRITTGDAPGAVRLEGSMHKALAAARRARPQP